MAKLIFLASLLVAAVTTASAQMAVLPQAPPRPVNQKEKIAAAAPTPIVTSFSSAIAGISCVSTKSCYTAIPDTIFEFDPTVTIATANLTRVTRPPLPPTGFYLQNLQLLGTGNSGHGGGVVTGVEAFSDDHLLYFYALDTPTSLRSVTFPNDVSFTTSATITTSPDGQRVFISDGSYGNKTTVVSVNGGQSYTVVPVVSNLPSPNYYIGSFSVSMATDKMWYLSVRDSTADTNVILKTVDGGNNFVALTVPNLDPKTYALRGIVCTDSGNTCYIASTYNDARVLRTLDGGKTWNTAFNEALPRGELAYLRNFVVAGSNVAFFIKDDLVLSKDKGETWTRIESVAGAGFGTPTNLNIITSEDGKDTVAIFASRSSSDSADYVTIFSLRL